MDILVSLTAISQALGIAKELKTIDRGIDEAEFKLKVADLVSALADAKISLADAQSEISQLRDKVAELEAGPLCPVCKTGRLAVESVSKWDGKTLETHACKCNSESCGYTTNRVFSTDRLRYRD